MSIFTKLSIFEAKQVKQDEKIYDAFNNQKNFGVNVSLKKRFGGLGGVKKEYTAYNHSTGDSFKYGSMTDTKKGILKQQNILKATTAAENTIDLCREGYSEKDYSAGLEHCDRVLNAEKEALKHWGDLPETLRIKVVNTKATLLHKVEDAWKTQHNEGQNILKALQNNQDLPSTALRDIEELQKAQLKFTRPTWETIANHTAHRVQMKEEQLLKRLRPIAPQTIDIKLSSLDWRKLLISGSATLLGIRFIEKHVPLANGITSLLDHFMKQGPIEFLAGSVGVFSLGHRFQKYITDSELIKSIKDLLSTFPRINFS